RQTCGHANRGLAAWSTAGQGITECCALSGWSGGGLARARAAWGARWVAVTVSPCGAMLWPSPEPSEVTYVGRQHLARAGSDVRCGRRYPAVHSGHIRGGVGRRALGRVGFGRRVLRYRRMARIWENTDSRDRRADALRPLD